MPMSLLDTKNSPYSLRYSIAANDTGSLARAQATMVADAAAGPLKALLTQLGPTGLGGLNTDPRVRTIVTPKGTAAAVRAEWTATGIIWQGEGACDAVVRIEFVPSSSR